MLHHPQKIRLTRLSDGDNVRFRLDEYRTPAIGRQVNGNLLFPTLAEKRPEHEGEWFQGGKGPTRASDITDFSQVFANFSDK